MISELRHWWKIILTAILVIGVLFSFFAFVEIIHIYTILRDAYRPLGYIFLITIAITIIWFLIYIILNIRKRPRVLIPPNIGDLSSVSQYECKKYCKYLILFLQRLTQNPHLTVDDTETARQKITQMKKLLESHLDKSFLLKEIDKTEKEFVEPLLSKLDEKAKAEIRKSVRDIMLGVTLSPFRSIDLLVIIYRNASMVNKVMAVYNSRPLLREQLFIFRDVLRIVATVNYMNFGEKLMEQLFSRVPYIGQAVDDFAQGVGAGLLTSVAGHGAIYRCRAYKRWDQEIAIKTMSAHIKEFMKDVKDLFKQDVLPKLRSKVYSATPSDQTEDPGFWEKTTNGISSALDATDSMIDNFVKKPVIAGSRGTVKLSSTAISKGKNVAVQGVSGLWKGTKYLSSGTGKGLKYAYTKASEASIYPKKLFRKLRRNKGPLE